MAEKKVDRKRIINDSTNFSISLYELMSNYKDKNREYEQKEKQLCLDNKYLLDYPTIVDKKIYNYISSALERYSGNLPAGAA